MSRLLVFFLLFVLQFACAAVFRTLLHPQDDSSTNHLSISNKIAAKGTVSVSSCQYYSVRVMLGTPQQQVNVLIDTDYGGFFMHEGFFNPSKSSTYKDLGKNVEVGNWGPYANIGRLGNDTFTIVDGTKKLVVKDQTFVRTKNVVSTKECSPLNGLNAVMGLWFQNLDDVRYDNPFQQAVKQKVLDDAVFALYFKRDVNRFGMPSTGAVTFGAVDTVNCAPVSVYAPVIYSTQWRFRMDSISFGNFKYGNGELEGVISSAMQYITVSYYFATQIYKEIGKEPNFNGTIPCSSVLPDFNINIQKSTTLAVKKTSYLRQIDNSQCNIRIRGRDDPGYQSVIELGLPFFFEYCTVLDAGSRRIGFAKHENPV